MAMANSSMSLLKSSFMGDRLLRCSRHHHPLPQLFRYNHKPGINHVSMQLPRSLSGLTNLLFNRRNIDELSNSKRKRLRPGIVSPRRKVPKDISMPPYVKSMVPAGIASGPEVHDEKGIECMRASGRLAAQVLQYAGTLVKNNMEPDPRPPGRPPRGRTNDERWEQMMQMMQQQQLMMQQQQAVTTSIMNHLAQAVGPAQPPPPSPPEATNRLFYDFHKLRPPTFLGSPVPSEAQSWLDEMTKIFLVVRCTEEDKVAFATHMLQGEAENWWKGAKTYMISAGTPMNWENFCTVFLDKYIPRSIRKQKEFEFTHLQQGDMSVADYVAKFEELARFCAQAEYAPNDRWKINQFEWGLNPEIKSNLAQLEITSYATLVHKSYIVEESLRGLKENRQLKWQQRRDAPKSNQQLKVKMPPNKGKQPQNSVVPQAKGPRECSKCGRSHPGECLYGKNICFWCKTPGHMSQDCPQRKMKGLTNSNSPPTGRVYTLNAKKAKGNNDLIAGKKA